MHLLASSASSTLLPTLWTPFLFVTWPHIHSTYMHTYSHYKQHLHECEGESRIFIYLILITSLIDRLFKSAHFSENVTVSFFFTVKGNSTVYTLHFLIMCSYNDDRYPDWIHFIDPVSSATLSTDGQVSLWKDTEYVGFMSRSATGGPFENSFIFLRKLHNDFHGGCN